MALNVEHLLRTAATLEQAMLALSSPRSVDALVFNDVLRHGGKHSLLDQAAVERWLGYRANRNSTAHDYGVGFANDTLNLLPAYLADVRLLATKLQGIFDAAS